MVRELRQQKRFTVKGCNYKCHFFLCSTKKGENETKTDFSGRQAYKQIILLNANMASFKRIFLKWIIIFRHRSDYN